MSIYDVKVGDNVQITGPIGAKYPMEVGEVTKVHEWKSQPFAVSMCLAKTKTRVTVGLVNLCFWPSQ